MNENANLGGSAAICIGTTLLTMLALNHPRARRSRALRVLGDLEATRLAGAAALVIFFLLLAVGLL